jgi:hypothetical protein
VTKIFDRPRIAPITAIEIGEPEKIAIKPMMA